MEQPGLQPALAEPWLDDEHIVDFAAKRRGFAVVSVKSTRVDVEIKSRTLEVLDKSGWSVARRTVL